MESIVDEAVEKNEDEEDLDDVSIQQPNTNSDKGMTDAEIDEIANSLKTRISVIGCGGGGCNTINRIKEEGIEGADLVALNTDAQDLQHSVAETKLLIGKETCGGRGAGSIPEQGEQSARENEEEIENIVQDQDMVFITAGMGGGTGTGSAPVVAEIASKHALTIAIVTTPFTAEGQARRKNADGGLKRLRKHADTVIVVPNDKLLDFAPNMPLKKAFRICDEVLMRSVKGITELITKPNLVNLDFADVKTIMKGGGVAMIGLGESDSMDGKADESVTGALDSPLLDVNIDNASNVLVNVTGGEEMQIDEAQGVVEHLSDRVSDEARIIWGAGVDENLGEKLRTMIVITGVDSPQIYGGEHVEEEVEEETTEALSTSTIDYVE